MMVATVRGRLAEFQGTIEAAPDYHDSKVSGTIRTASIDTNEPKRDEHLRSADFFDADNHPEISFESKTIEHLRRGDYRVAGDLTMHGETREIVLEGTVQGIERDPWGNDRVGIELRGTISRGDFGLRWQQALETGGVLVGDEVRVAADISAVRKTEDTT